jgi:sec-independent protein translocase protein TatC
VSEGRMTFGDHLEELRVRIMRAGFAVLLGMVVGWHFREKLFAWLLRPLEIAWFCRARQGCTVQGVYDWMLHADRFRVARAAGEAQLRAHPNGFPVDPQIHFPDPTSAFVSYLKIAAIGGFVIALPVVFYQLWAFIAPGLYDREKKLIMPFVVFSTLFFLGGALFGYHFVFPVGYEWFLGFGGMVAGTQVKVVPTIMMDEYLGFTSQMLLAFGVVFQLPLFVFFLSLAGIVTWQQLLKFGRYFTVIAFVVAAILTPTPDVYSQVMLALPLVVLYFVAVGLAFLLAPKKKKDDEPAKDAALAALPDHGPAKKIIAAKEAAAKKAAMKDAPPAGVDIRAEKIKKWEAEQERLRAAKIMAGQKKDPTPEKPSEG